MEDCLEALGANLGVNLAFLAKEPSALPEDGVLLGANGHAYGLHDSRRGALSVWDGNTSAGTLCLNLYTLRNAAGVVMVVSDPETGEVYDAREELLLEKSGKSSFSPEIVPSASFAWEGTDAREKPLPDGTLVQVDVYAWLDTDEDIQSAYRGNVRRTAPESYRWLLEDAYDAYRALSFPVTLDGAPPAAEASLNGSTLTVTGQPVRFLCLRPGRQRKAPDGERVLPGGAGHSLYAFRKLFRQCAPGDSLCPDGGLRRQYHRL